MKLKTFISKLDKARDEFLKEHGKEPTIFAIVNDWDDTLEITITSKVIREGTLWSADAKATEEIKIKYWDY